MSAGAWDLPELARPLPRRGRAACVQRPRVLPHYGAVVRFVYDNRYATSDQVRRRFAGHMRSGRTAQYQLARLVELGYLATAPVRSTSPNFPYVFSVTTAGVRFLREQNGTRDATCRPSVTERPGSRGMALQSLLHEVLLTEFDLMVWRTIRDRDDLERLFMERRYFRREDRLRFDHHGRSLSIEPDSGFLLRQTSRALQTSGRPEAPLSPTLLLHLTELDNGTMSAARVAQKLRRYDAWWGSADSREYLQSLYALHGSVPRRPNFRLLLIAHDKDRAGADLRRLTEILVHVLELSSNLRRQIWLTTAEQLAAVASRPAPLTAPVWWRARDVAPWLPAYRNLPRRRGPAHGKLRREFVDNRLPQLPTHSLLGSAAEGTTAELHFAVNRGTLSV